MKRFDCFVDGSTFNGGLNTAGPSGWVSLFTVEGKVIKELGNTYRRSNSSTMEETAFLETLKAWGFGETSVLVIHTDYLGALQALEAIAKGYIELGYASKAFVREVREVLKSKGVELHKVTNSKSGRVVSSCGRLEVKKVKAHVNDDKALEDLSFVALGNRAADKKAKEWANKSMI